MVDALEASLAKVWMWRARPDNPFEHPDYKALVEVCHGRFPQAGSPSSLGWALSNALDRLGAPFSLPRAAAVPLSPAPAAVRLERAFLATQAQQLHLCPLDLADDLPVWSFGKAEVRTFSSDELLDLIDPFGVDRLRPFWSFDADRFSRINWLLVRDTVTLDADVGKRAWPFLFETLDKDYSKIEPHQERFPTVVERALFALLLAPWEDWTEHRELNWRAFTVPWAHTVDEDLFVARHRLPSAETLSFEPDFYERDGETIEVERRVRYPLYEAAMDVNNLVNDAFAAQVDRAADSTMFETPIAHFLVRAFGADGIDEFIGHLTMLEAALGQREPFSTAKVRARVAALLNDPAAAAAYGDLFELRSQFVHGRTMDAISGEERCQARGLARRVAVALVERADSEAPSNRSAELEVLRIQGEALLKPAKTTPTP